MLLFWRFSRCSGRSMASASAASDDAVSARRVRVVRYMAFLTTCVVGTVKGI